MSVDHRLAAFRLRADIFSLRVDRERSSYWGDVSSSIPLFMEMKSQQHLIFIFHTISFFLSGGETWLHTQYIVYHNSNSIECLS